MQSLRKLRIKLSIAWNFLIEFLKYMVLYPFAVWKYRGRDIFLISERGVDARDNGYHMFRYMCLNHPEEETYYVITKDSPDYPKVKDLGKVVFHKTLQHYLLFIAAKYKISTHIAGYSPNINFYARYVGRIPWRGKRIFLQHGVIAADLPLLYYEKTLLDLFICGAKPEYDYVAGTFHYEDQVKYTGLARYDCLHNATTKKQILAMPTWRLFLASATQEELAASEYVTRWNGILQNQRLIDALNEEGYTLVFYPHYEMQKNIHLFSSCDPAVVIADFAHFDVQQLLKESQLLLTDYSSVFFDVGYMRKTSIYYQFDKERFCSKHYKAGYFDYETMGFGEVVQTEEDCIDLLVDYLKNQCAFKKEYEARAESFFELHDTHNCERIYREIKKMDETKAEKQ